MMRRMILVLILLLLPVSVFASEYVLIKGKGIEVCEEYGKNLNSIRHIEYERKLNPEFKDFSKPEWEKMYPEHMESEKLFPKIDLFLWERDINPASCFPWRVEKWHGTSKQMARAWKCYKGSRQYLLGVGLPISRVDIDNDGKMENIAFDSGNKSVLLVLNDDKTDINIKKTSLVLQHPSRKAAGKGEFTAEGEIVADVVGNFFYDVFIYKQKTYFDLFIDLWEKGKKLEHGSAWGELRVFIIEQQKTQEICTYTE